MLDTVLVAAMGYATTLLAVWLTARWQRKGARDAEILQTQVRVYGECAETLYEFERANFNRARAHLAARPEEHREMLRQEAYRREARARSAIGQAAFLSGSEGLEDQFESVRAAVHSLSDAANGDDLDRRHQEIQEQLKAVLRNVRSRLKA